MRLYLLPLLLATLPLKAFSGSDQFAWFSNEGTRNYNEFCDTSVDNNARKTCVCRDDIRGPNGQFSYFSCTSHCDTSYMLRTGGYCVQCPAGTFYGNYASYIQSTDVGRGNYLLETVDGSFGLVFVFSHTANLNHPDYFASTKHCQTCPAGSYAVQGQQYCRSCLGDFGDGYVSDAGSSTCYQCEAGTHANIDPDNVNLTPTKCLKCEAGYYQDEAAKTSCKEAPAGTYVENPGQTHFSNCDEGTFASERHSTSCTVASLGHYATSRDSDYGPTAQYPCPAGSYASTPGQSSCTPCPPYTSTEEIGSMSASDCKLCPYGVDPFTFGCTAPDEDDGVNPLENICWNPAQLLSLRNTIAVEDLFRLVYQQPGVGMNTLIENGINTMLMASNGKVTYADIQELTNSLVSGAANWLEAIYDETKTRTCVDNLTDIMKSNEAAKKILSYQFGKASLNSRISWIAQLRCTGQTFGCARSQVESVDSCPMAMTCFGQLERIFAPVVNSPGGMTWFGSSKGGGLGRPTPPYSLSFIQKEIKQTITTLTDWGDTRRRLEKYQTLLAGIETTQEIIVGAVEASATVSAAKATADIKKSYIEGNLYYSQSAYNYNMTYLASETLDDQGSDLEELFKECYDEIKKESLIHIVKSTIGFAKDIVEIVATDGAVGREDMMKNGIKIFKTMYEYGNTVYEDGKKYGEPPFNPAKQMPSLPDSLVDPVYANETSEWYFSSEKNVSQSLVNMSAAYWSDIYLQNEKTVQPVIESPPDCEDYKGDIKASLKKYLINVKNMTNYGYAFTTAQMNLVPQIGNIASGLATIEALDAATHKFQGSAGLVPVTPPDIRTVPATYNDDATALFKTRFEDNTTAALGFAQAASLLSRQYGAAQACWAFCKSFSYMNAGLELTDGMADCTKFSALYLPTTDTFKESADALVQNKISIPPSVATLNKNLENFANSVMNSPIDGFGPPGSISNPKSFQVEFDANDPHLQKKLTGGDLTQGNVEFSLSASSLAMFESANIGVYVAGINPRVINVEAFWGGVTSPRNSPMSTNINVKGPFVVYKHGTGCNQSYSVPKLVGASGNFAQVNTIETTAPTTSCDTTSCVGDTLVKKVTWNDHSTTCFCTSQSESFLQPAPDLSKSAFVYPSLWANWAVKADEDLWEDFTIDLSQLKLMVRFAYVESSDIPTKSSQTLQVCLRNYEEFRSKYPGPNPLLSGLICTGVDECAECSVGDTNNTIAFFALCDVWTGALQACQAKDNVVSPVLGAVHNGFLKIILSVTALSFVVIGLAWFHAHRKRRTYTLIN